jgi:hypothetical protein
MRMELAGGLGDCTVLYNDQDIHHAPTLSAYVLYV